MIDYFTGSKFRIDINSNLTILMMSRMQKYNFGSRRSQTLLFFLSEYRRMKTSCAPLFDRWSSQFFKYFDMLSLKYFQIFLITMIANLIRSTFYGSKHSCSQKKVAVKFKSKRQRWIGFNEIAGQEIIKDLKKIILGTTENDIFTWQ